MAEEEEDGRVRDRAPTQDQDGMAGWGWLLHPGGVVRHGPPSGLRAGRFDRLRTGSPRTVSRVALTGRGRFETGPYAKSGWNGGIGGVGSAGGGGLPGVWFDRLTRDAGCGRVVGWRWVPAPFGRLRAGLTPGWRGKKTGGSGLGAGRGGSTRPSVDSGSAHHERAGAADAGCAEDGRVGDRAPTQDRDADAGMAGGRG